MMEDKVLVNKGSLESMADNIKAISEALRKSYGNVGQLNQEAMVTLIARASRVNRGDVSLVLDWLKLIDKEFIVQPKREQR